MWARLAQRAALSTFGQEALFVIDGRRCAARGIFVAAHESIKLIGDAPVSSVQPALTVRASDLPAAPVDGDEVEVNGRHYVIVDCQPDGYGMLRLILQEA